MPPMGQGPRARPILCACLAFVRALPSGPRIRMIAGMRTTLVLDDRLVREAKRRAADTGTTLSEVVNDALREALRPSSGPVPPFRMITYGDPHGTLTLTPEDVKEMELQDDIESLR